MNIRMELRRLGADNIHRRTIKGLAGEIRDRYEEKHKLDLLFGECVIRVASNSRPVIDGLAEYFGGFTCAGRAVDISISVLEGPPPQYRFHYVYKRPDPGKSRIKEEYVDLSDGRVVRKRLTGMVFLFGGDHHLAVGPCLANLNQVVNFINNRYIQRLLWQGYLLGHAAGVASEHGGLALTGFSGMGKSTLALHLLGHDLSFVSNDRVLVGHSTQGLIMRGVPKQPRINPGTILNNRRLRGVIPPEERTELSRLSGEELWQLEQKYDVFVDQVYGEGRFRLEAPLTDLMILNWRRDGSPTRIEPVDLSERRDLLGAFIKPPGLFFESRGGSQESDLSEDAYLRMLTSCRVHEVCGGVDFEKAARACRDVLSRAPEKPCGGSDLSG